MLIIMHHRNVHLPAKAVFNLETIWGFNVLQVDTAESRFQRFHYIDKLINVFGVQLDIKHIDIREDLEEYSLPFHHGLRSFGTYITQTKHCCAIGYYCDEVSLRRIGIHQLTVLRYSETWLG